MNNTNQTDFSIFDHENVSSQDDSSLHNSSPKLAWIVDPILIVYLSAWIGNFINKFWGKFHPVHIFSTNILFDYLLVMIINLLTHSGEIFFGKNDSFCFWFDFLFNWAKFSLNVGLWCPEINRFLALFWNLEYEERMTVRRAWFIIATIKTITFFLHLLYTWIFGLFFQCQSSRCPHLETKYFYPIVTSLIFSFTITFCVSLYVFNVARKQQNAVAPTNMLNQQQNQQNQQQNQQQTTGTLSTIAKLSKIGVKVNIISICQSLTSIPVLCFLIILRFSNLSCDNDDVLFVVQIVLVSSLVSFILVPIFINRKLKLYSEYYN